MEIGPSRSLGQRQPKVVMRQRANGSDGLVYPGVRVPDGLRAGPFCPDRAQNAIQVWHLNYHRDGKRLDLYRDGGSVEVFRVR